MKLRPKEPDFSPEDTGYSMIRWLPSTIENASGPHVSDPRTGEILESDIQFYHNGIKIKRKSKIILSTRMKGSEKSSRFTEEAQRWNERVNDRDKLTSLGL